MTTRAAGRTASRVSTGIAGLDDVLCGGLPTNRFFLIQGTPGVGKTTFALQYLRAGVEAGERVLYVTLSETREEILEIAASHGWSLDGVNLYELSSMEQALRLEQENTLYAPSDVELKETVRMVLAEVERVQPRRLVIDSLSELRLLAQTPVRYRRQLLGLKQHFAGKQCTVVLLDDRTDTSGDLQVESLAHGVVSFEQLPLQYGADRRRVRVTKLRGSPFRSGYHDFIIETGGLVVFPRLVAAEHRAEFVAERLPSGVRALDDLLGGGIDRGTAALVLGPAGTGKSVIATQIVCTTATRGEPCSMFLFEERLGTLVLRADQLGMNLSKLIDSGLVTMQQIDPAELAPDQFIHLVRRAVVDHGARVVVIDSLNGYFTAMPEARFLALQMHELLSFLAERGVATILTVAQAGIVGQMTSPIDVSYLADTVLLLRYFEAHGRMRKAVSVVKKRSGRHEDTIRELTLDARGVHFGPPLEAFRGVLTGVPVPAGEAALPSRGVP